MNLYACSFLILSREVFSKLEITIIAHRLSDEYY